MRVQLFATWTYATAGFLSNRAISQTGISPRKRGVFTRGPPAMIEVMRTNDIVLITLVEAILGERGINVFVADQFTSAVEGSLGILPRRVLVPEEDLAAARRALSEAGLEHELAAQPALRPVLR